MANYYLQRVYSQMGVPTGDPEAEAGVAVAVAAPPTVIARRIELLEITVPDGMNADNQVYNQGILLTQLPMRP